MQAIYAHIYNYVLHIIKHIHTYRHTYIPYKKCFCTNIYVIYRPLSPGKAADWKQFRKKNLITINFKQQCFITPLFDIYNLHTRTYRLLFSVYIAVEVIFFRLKTELISYRCTYIPTYIYIIHKGVWIHKYICVYRGTYRNRYRYIWMWTVFD